MKRISLISALLAILLAIGSTAALSQQTRKFPADSQLGNLTAVSFPEFTINGQKMVMSAGGQIRGIDNLIILPSTANYIGLVRYQLDIMGYLHRVWFLTPDEVREAENEGQQIPKPRRRFIFF